jgi:hypothetical protein
MMHMFELVIHGIRPGADRTELENLVRKSLPQAVASIAELGVKAGDVHVHTPEDILGRESKHVFADALFPFSGSTPEVRRELASRIWNVLFQFAIRVLHPHSTVAVSLGDRDENDIATWPSALSDAPPDDA